MNLIRLLRDTMTSNKLMFVYRGEVTGNNLLPLLMLLEREMVNSEFGFQGRKRLFMFVLESLQNVSRHSNKSIHADMSLVVFAKTDNGYTVTTGNVLPAADTDSLRQKLEEINNLDMTEIRTIYRQMLSSSEFSSKGGAGLGLIEMAKKTGNKLDYDFVAIDDEYSYFILSKTVDTAGTGFNMKGEKTRYSGESIMKLEKLMAGNNIYMIWSGHISPDISKEVLYFTETRLKEEEIEGRLKKRIFAILVEILENVSRYSAGRDAEKQFGMPVATMRVDGDVYSLTTGNLVRSDAVDDLRKKLDKVNSLDEQGLKNIMKEFLLGKGSGSGMPGLVDVAMQSSEKLQYSFEKVNDSYSYFLLKVKVNPGRVHDRVMNPSDEPSQTA